MNSYQEREYIQKLERAGLPGHSLRYTAWKNWFTGFGVVTVGAFVLLVVLPMLAAAAPEVASELQAIQKSS